MKTKTENILMSQSQPTQEWEAFDIGDIVRPMPSRRYGKYMSRSKAARAIQTGYRRYKTASQDKRDLSRVVRSYRAANPYQIQPSAGRTVSFWRKTQLNYPLGQTTGFNGGGMNINFGFSLGRLVAFIDGVFATSSPITNASEFQALFDYYKINAVKMQIFFSRNTDLITSSGNISAMPIMLICNDFDDIAESMTLNAMNERVGVRYAQFDSNNVKGITHYVKPKPVGVVVQTNVDTGVLSSANAGVTFGSQWLDCAQSNIVHNGIKVYYNNQGVTTVNTLGTVTFVFDVEYQFKGYR